MDTEKSLSKLKSFSPFLFGLVEKILQKFPFFKKEVEAQTDSVMSSLESMTRPYRFDYTTYKNFLKKDLSTKKSKE